MIPRIIGGLYKNDLADGEINEIWPIPSQHEADMATLGCISINRRHGALKGRALHLIGGR